MPLKHNNKLHTFFEKKKSDETESVSCPRASAALPRRSNIATVLAVRVVSPQDREMRLAWERDWWTACLVTECEHHQQVGRDVVHLVGGVCVQLPWQYTIGDFCFSYICLKYVMMKFSGSAGFMQMLRWSVWTENTSSGGVQIADGVIHQNKKGTS